MNRRDLLRSALFLVPALFLPEIGLAAADDLTVAEPLYLGEHAVVRLDTDPPLPPIDVYFNGEEVGDRCVAMCVSPLANIEVEGWCEFLTGIRTGMVWWSPRE